MGGPTNGLWWQLNEIQLSLSAEQAQVAKSALESLAACPSVVDTQVPDQRRMTRVSSSPVVFAGRRGGGIDALTGLSLQGRTLIMLGSGVRAADPAAPAALPVGPSWLSHLISVASQRAAAH